MDKETKKCPFCGEEIMATAKKCKHCKQFLPNDNENKQESTTKTCPFCGEEIMTQAKKCKHCGEWLDYHDKKDQNSIVHCKFCGKAVSFSAEKCPNCGEWLKDENPEFSCGYGIKNRATRLIINFSIFIAVIVFILCLIMTLNEQMTAEQMTNSILITIIAPPITFAICFLCAYTYFLPTVYAVARNHPQVVPIFFVNFFFGETVLGWVVCMVWATTHRQGRHTHW